MKSAFAKNIERINREEMNAPVDVAKLRETLEQRNGIPDLEIVAPDNPDRAIELFRRDGFVVVRGVLDETQIQFLKQGCDEAIAEILAVDTDKSGNRGSGRYSFGGSSLTRSQLHRPAWQMMLEIDLIHDLLTAIFGSDDYILRAASGDFCLPGTANYQPLHSDVGEWKGAGASPYSSYHDPRGAVALRDLPSPYVCVNFLPQDVTALNGPTRQVPGTQNSRAEIPNLREEPEWMKLSTVCPAPAGSIMIRDVRAWHGGTPNLSDQVRAIPNLEFYAPWFREPMVPGISYADHKKLSERAQRLTRYSVLDSSEELKTGAVLFAP